MRAGTEQVLFVADSKTHDPHLYENVRKITGNVQAVFIGTAYLGQTVEAFIRSCLAGSIQGNRRLPWKRNFEPD